MPRPFSALAAAALWLAAGDAAAGGLELDAGGARAIGRAGATLVSDDGNAALLQNPAGMARRDRLRFAAGTTVRDPDAAYRTANRDAISDCPTDPPLAPPDVADRAGSVIAPELGAQGRLGPLVIGAAYLETANIDHRLADLRGIECEDEITRNFPHRYAGVALQYRRSTVAAGAAMRVSDWVAVGVSASLSAVSLHERRNIWPAFPDAVSRIGEPSRDLVLDLSARDLFVPGVIASAFVAPPYLPLEATFGLGVSKGASMSGNVLLLSRPRQGLPPPDIPEAIVEMGAASSIDLGAPLDLRAGVRYLGERLVAELVGEITFYLGADERETWQVQGVAVRDPTTRQSLGTVPALITQRAHGAARAAVDFELLPGFLWLTGGYAYASAPVRPRYLAPVQVELASHNLAAGVEVLWGDLAVTVGYAHSLSARVQVLDTAVELVNPFDPGHAPAANGSYQSSSDMFGMNVELSWPETRPGS